MLNDGNDPHLALWLAEVPAKDVSPGKARPVLFFAVLMLLLSVGLVCTSVAL
jgi:hypothetical protein